VSEGSRLRENALWLMEKVLQILRIDRGLAWSSSTRTAENTHATAPAHNGWKDTETAFLEAQRNIAGAYLFIERQKLRRLAS
jgi:hypothetical protein